MGIQINGQTDTISASDGSLSVSGYELTGPSNINVTGVVTATTFRGNIVGTAATFTGNVSIAGTLTYEDVTNVDSVGLVTARAGANVATTSGNLLVGSATSTGTASQPLQVTGGAYVSGSVGIGTTNPQQTLHVVGIITATSYRGDGSQLTGVSVGTDITSSLFS